MPFGADDLGGLEEAPLKMPCFKSLCDTDSLGNYAIATCTEELGKDWMEKDTRTAFKDLNLKTFAH